MKKVLTSIIFVLAICLETFAINAPSITSPSNGATNQDLSLFIDWTDIAGNEGYVYQLDTVFDFSSAYFIQDTTGTNESYKYLSNLFFGQTYYWRVMTLSSSGNSVWSSTWSFTTKVTVGITSPSNGAINQNIELFIDWTDITGNTGYMYQIDTTSNFNSPLFEQGTTATNSSFVSQSNLLFGIKYYWRACAKSVNDTSVWSSIWCFTTKSTVNITSPSNGAINQDTSLYIDWTDITGNDGYMYQIDTSQNFNSSLLQQGVTAQNSSFVSISNLLYGTKYYWRACVKSAVDTSIWSNTWYFTTSYQLTSAPNLISPANGSIGISYVSTDLEWSSVAGATAYQYQYSEDNTFNSGVYNGTTGSLSETINNLNQTTTYFWRVRGQNSSGFSPWSTIWEFTTDNNVVISNLSNISSIQIFPNPTSSILTIIGKGIIKLEVINFNGKIIDNKIAENDMSIFDLRTLPSGIYLIKVVTDRNVIYKKVIKE